MVIALKNVLPLSKESPVRRWISPLRVAAAATLLTLVPGYFWGHHLEQERRFVVWRQEQRVRDALHMPVRVILPNSKRSTLKQAISQLRRQIPIPVALNPRIADAAIAPQYLIAQGAGAQGIYQGPLDSVLDQLLRSADTQETAVYRIQGGGIAITTSPTEDHQIVVQVHPTPSGGPNRIAFNEEQVVNLITTCIDPIMWDDVGGTWNATASPGAVTIVSTSDGHRSVSLLLRQLADLPARPKTLLPVAILESHLHFPYGATESEAIILRALGQIDSFTYSEVPLHAFLADLSARFDVPMMLAIKKLEEAAIDLDTPVTIDLPNISLRGCLRQALGELGLTYVAKDGGIVIMPPEDAGSMLYHLAYPVHDLLESDPESDVDLLLDLIISEVDPDCWDDVGGPGSIESLAHGWLLVSQTQDTHIKMEQFLREVRHAARSPNWPAVELDPQGQAVARIEAALRSNGRLQADVLPLNEFAKKLQRKLDFPVVLRLKALEEAAIALDVPVCCQLEQQPLWRWLQETLAMNEVSFRIDGECIEITTPEDAAGSYRRSVHNLRDLTEPGLDFISKEAVTNLIIHAVDPDSWESRGGAASLNWFGDCLFVAHDGLTQFEVRELIDYLREHRAELPRLELIKKMNTTSAEYQRLVEESEHSTDLWRAAWLRFALGTPLPPPEPTGPFGCYALPPR